MIDSLKRALPGVVACAALLAGCSGGGSNNGLAHLQPSGTLSVSSASGKVSTSASSRMTVAQGTSQNFQVAEDWYIGAFTASVVNGGASGCITVAAAPGAGAGTAPFTVSAQAASATCVYPMTADVQFVDAWNNTTTLYVQAN